MKLSVKGFGIATGLIFGCGLLFITWWIILFEGQTGDTTLIGRVYLGYSISWGGSFFGLLWGLVDGFIGGAIFAWLYNCFSGVTKTQDLQDTA
ncbi:MAG: bacteriophage holin [Candidatus Delongbacteria bacterium]|nr:bacteriophage holin [Candidatus Delongbacteria bacterium]